MFRFHSPTPLEAKHQDAQQCYLMRLNAQMLANSFPRPGGKHPEGDALQHSVIRGLSPAREEKEEVTTMVCPFQMSPGKGEKWIPDMV